MLKIVKRFFCNQLMYCIYLIYIQLRCSIELSGDYITSLHVIFFKIYDKNTLLNKKKFNYSLGKNLDVNMVFIIRYPIKIGKNPIFSSHKLLFKINLMEEVIM